MSGQRKGGRGKGGAQQPAVRDAENSSVDAASNDQQRKTANLKKQLQEMGLFGDCEDNLCHAALEMTGWQPDAAIEKFLNPSALQHLKDSCWHDPKKQPNRKPKPVAEEPKRKEEAPTPSKGKGEKGGRGSGKDSMARDKGEGRGGSRGGKKGPGLPMPLMPPPTDALKSMPRPVQTVISPATAASSSIKPSPPPPSKDVWGGNLATKLRKEKEEDAENAKRVQERALAAQMQQAQQQAQHYQSAMAPVAAPQPAAAQAQPPATQGGRAQSASAAGRGTGRGRGRGRGADKDGSRRTEAVDQAPLQPSIDEMYKTLQQASPQQQASQPSPQQHAQKPLQPMGGARFQDTPAEPMYSLASNPVNLPPQSMDLPLEASMGSMSFGDFGATDSQSKPQSYSLGAQSGSLPNGDGSLEPPSGQPMYHEYHGAEHGGAMDGGDAVSEAEQQAHMYSQIPGQYGYAYAGHQYMMNPYPAGINELGQANPYGAPPYTTQQYVPKPNAQGGQPANGQASLGGRGDRKANAADKAAAAAAAAAGESGSQQGTPNPSAMPAYQAGMPMGMGAAQMNQMYQYQGYPYPQPGFINPGYGYMGFGYQQQYPGAARAGYNSKASQPAYGGGYAGGYEQSDFNYNAMYSGYGQQMPGAHPHMPPQMPQQPQPSAADSASGAAKASAAASSPSASGSAASASGAQPSASAYGGNSQQYPRGFAPHGYAAAGSQPSFSTSAARYQQQPQFQSQMQVPAQQQAPAQQQFAGQQWSQ